jgi:Ni/Co efflux regulator RcnB
MLMVNKPPIPAHHLGTEDISSNGNPIHLRSIRCRSRHTIRGKQARGRPQVFRSGELPSAYFGFRVPVEHLALVISNSYGRCSSPVTVTATVANPAFALVSTISGGEPTTPCLVNDRLCSSMFGLRANCAGHIVPLSTTGSQVQPSHWLSMKIQKYLPAIVAGAALTVFAGATLAQDRSRDDRGRAEDRDRGADNRDHQNNNHGRAAYHFRAEDRDRFAPHYQRDIKQWQQHADRRHHFRAGERVPSGIRLKSVPSSYYRELPPPPPGYRFGYYDGYVVAYDPTTQIVADVLDLVNAAVHR